MFAKQFLLIVGLKNFVEILMEKLEEKIKTFMLKYYPSWYAQFLKAPIL